MLLVLSDETLDRLTLICGVSVNAVKLPESVYSPLVENVTAIETIPVAARATDLVSAWKSASVYPESPCTSFCTRYRLSMVVTVAASSLAVAMAVRASELV